MSTRIASVAALLAAGCGDSDAEVAAAMEQALRDANLAVAGALVADESTVHAHEVPDTQLRHGTDACGCPCTERSGSPPSTFLLTLDYHDSACLPDSGLLPTLLAGRMVLTVTGEEVDATLDGMTLGFEHPLSGRIAGTVVPSTLAIDAGGELDLDGRALELAVAVDNGADALALGGEVTVDGTLVRLEAVELPRERLGPPCPTPTEGRFAVIREGEEEVVIDLAEPGLGEVTATRGERISDPVPWCAYDGRIW